MPTTRHTHRTTENPSPLQELQALIRSRTQPMASIDEFQDSGDERGQFAEVPRPSVEGSVPETPTGTVPSRESTQTPVGRQTASEEPAHSPNNLFYVRRDDTTHTALGTKIANRRESQDASQVARFVGVAGDVAGVAGHCGALPQVMHGVASHLQVVFVAVSRHSAQDYLSVSDFPYIKHLYLQPQKKFPLPLRVRAWVCVLRRVYSPRVGLRSSPSLLPCICDLALRERDPRALSATSLRNRYPLPPIRATTCTSCPYLRRV